MTESLTTITMANFLHDDLELGSPNSPVLEQFGYRKIDNRGHKALIPPATLPELYRAIYRLILNRSGGDIRNRLLPGIEFSRRNPETKVAEITIVRPVLDEIPKAEEGWEMASEQMSTRVFAELGAQGKIPLQIAMHTHDTAHVADLILNPDWESELLKFFAQDANRLKIHDKPATVMQMGFYVNEFLMVPWLHREKEIRELLALKLDRPHTADELRRDLRSGALAQRIDRLAKNYFYYFEMHGGGALDGYSLRSFPVRSIQNLARITVQQGYRPTVGAFSTGTGGLNSFLGGDSYWGLVQQLLLFESLRETDSSVPPETLLEPHGYSPYIRAEELTAEAKSRLGEAQVQVMQRLENKILSAFRHKITGLRILQDINAGETYLNSPTFRYYSSFAVPGTLEGELFLKPLTFGAP